MQDVKRLCPNCKEELEECDGVYYCSNCGKKFKKAADNVSDSTVEQTSQKQGTAKEEFIKIKENIVLLFKSIMCMLVDFAKSKKNIVALSTSIICILVVCTFLARGIFNGGFSNNAIRKIVELNSFEDFVDIKTVKEISKIELETDVSGISPGTSLVLLNSDKEDGYLVVLVNYSDQQMQLLDYGNYFPLQTILDTYIVNLNEQEQIEHLECLAGYINEYGVDCFENRDVAEAYIKETKRFYDVKAARESITGAAMYKLPNAKSISDFKVIFEGETAVPLYYAFMTKSVERNPNWGFIDIDSLNGIQLDFFTQRFGPVYIEKETWHAYSRDFNLMDRSFKSDTYKDLEEALLDTHIAVYGSFDE